ALIPRFHVMPHSKEKSTPAACASGGRTTDLSSRGRCVTYTSRKTTMRPRSAAAGGLLGLQPLNPIRVDERRAVIGLARRAIFALGQKGTNPLSSFGDAKMTARSRYETGRPVFLEPPAARVDEVPLFDPSSFFDSVNFDFQEIVGFQGTLAVEHR